MSIKVQVVSVKVQVVSVEVHAAAAAAAAAVGILCAWVCFFCVPSPATPSTHTHTHAGLYFLRAGKGGQVMINTWDALQQNVSYARRWNEQEGLLTFLQTQVRSGAVWFHACMPEALAPRQTQVRVVRTPADTHPCRHIW